MILFGLSLLFTLDKTPGMPLAWCILVYMVVIFGLFAMAFRKIYYGEKCVVKHNCCKH